MTPFLLLRTPRTALLIFAAISALTLAVALVAQYGFDLHPCHLCLLQRYPYAAVIAIGLIGAFAFKTLRLQRFAILACALLFLVGGGIAAYHTGVEYGVFPGPSSCTDDGAGASSIEEMRKQIMNAPIVACDQAMAHVMGLSMAGWNALLYAFLMVLGFYSYSRTTIKTPAP